MIACLQGTLLALLVSSGAITDNSWSSYDQIGVATGIQVCVNLCWRTIPKVYIKLQLCMHVSLKHTNPHTRTRTRTHTHARAHKHTNTHMHTYARTQAHICTHTHARMHTCAHTGRQARRYARPHWKAWVQQPFSILIAFKSWSFLPKHIALSSLVKLHLIHSLQDFLICIEMFVAALAHAFAFPPKVCQFCRAEKECVFPLWLIEKLTQTCL